MSVVPESLSAWLVERFIPGWVARAWRPRLPGYIENVSWRDGRASETQTFSTMVTGRLVYAFSLCHVVGGGESCLEAATHGIDALLGAVRRSDGGFVHTLAEDGAVADARGDLYDIAFVLLAFGGYVAASGRRDLLDLAEEIGAGLDRDPKGGFRELEAGNGPRLQYPQMHLFEAFQLLARLAPGQGWEARADEVVDLVERRLMQPDGCINEWYDAEWRPVEADGDPERELGHQFEWAWLLYRYGWTFGAARATALADRIYANGKRILRSAVGDLIIPLPNRVDRVGRARDRQRPLWPLTELLRAACLNEIAQRGTGNAEIAGAALSTMFAHYIDADTGLWINVLDPGEIPADRTVPSRLLYHIIPALITFAREREAAFDIRSPILDRYTL